MGEGVGEGVARDVSQGVLGPALVENLEAQSWALSVFFHLSIIKNYFSALLKELTITYFCTSPI